MARHAAVVQAPADWNEPLEEWFEVLDRLRTPTSPNDPAPSDVAYWYNERATLSTLAGALWLTGGLVFEEHCTRRGANGPNAGSGRTDMWCRTKQAAYTIEAKQGVRLSYPATPRSLGPWADLQLKAAEAQCLTDDFAEVNCLALVFMVPSLKASPTREDLEPWIQEVNRFHADMKAHYFDLPSIQGGNENRFFPGVILLGRMVTPLALPDE